jgi:hypothetical protein
MALSLTGLETPRGLALEAPWTDNGQAVHLVVAGRW